jgi:hypothetical protein
VFNGAQYQKGDKEIIVKLLEGNDPVGGRTVSEWIPDWWNWSLSSRIDYDQKGDVYFLRANPKFNESKDARDFTINSSPAVHKNQAILFPGMSTMIDKGTFPNLDTHEKRIEEAKKDNNDPQTNFTCTIDGDDRDILGGNGKDKIRMSSKEFELDAPDKCQVRIDYPVAAGPARPAATDGYFLCIKELPPHKDPYVIKLYSKGIEGYHGTITYQVKVE